MNPFRILTGTFLLAITLMLSPAFGQQPADIARYALPDKVGGLEVRLGNFQVRGVSLRPDGSGIQIGAADKDGGMVTIFVQLSDGPGGATACRAKWWPETRDSFVKKTNAKLVGVTQYELNDVAIVEYRIPEFQGKPVNQSIIHTYYAGGDIWAEVHLSRMGDVQPLKTFLSRVKILPDYKPRAMEYLEFGSARYEEHDYANAAKYYQHALDLHNGGDTLAPVLWKVLVDNLGMSYGISGDNERAQKVFLAGIQQDPSYPMFYYNLACADAGMNDLDGALENLKKAHEHKANMLPGESLPDPKTDDSFTKYANDPKFQAAARSFN